MPSRSRPNGRTTAETTGEPCSPHHPIHPMTFAYTDVSQIEEDALFPWLASDCMADDYVADDYVADEFDDE